MNKQNIQLLFHYNSWANERILRAAERVTAAQFIAPSDFPHGGLRGALVHTLFAEWLWRRRCEGVSPTERLKDEDFPTLAVLRDRWKQEETKLNLFIESLTDSQLNSPLEYKNTQGVAMREPLMWTLLAHLVNHGTQHRGEAAAILTQLGHSPGDIDLIIFLREQK
ncbi:MAG: hypothetical protein HFACDABA_00405 [Anaerolineales bacterium]|nr:hypothetical protein [Anaerolineales bacterium]